MWVLLLFPFCLCVMTNSSSSMSIVMAIRHRKWCRLCRSSSLASIDVCDDEGVVLCVSDCGKGRVAADTSNCYLTFHKLQLLLQGDREWVFTANTTIHKCREEYFEYSFEYFQYFWRIFHWICLRLVKDKFLDSENIRATFRYKWIYDASR